jgi:hypothetical protein
LEAVWPTKKIQKSAARRLPGASFAPVSIRLDMALPLHLFRGSLPLRAYN